ncbi:MAG: alpha/beta fold hydrolase [Dinoroseobacter sp.]|nr:alpha/beta fold hydrolase [Dinoroseobacter sp.]
MSDLSVLLVHGEFHGAWCWRDVIPALRSLGVSARAIDLPGHGADPTPIRSISLESYARAIMSNLSPNTLIVGHGMAGYPMSAASEAMVDSVAGMVFVSAFVPQPKKSIADLRAAAPIDGLAGKTERTDDGYSQTISPVAVDDLFYHDCPPGVLTYAAARINREPVAPLHTPLQALDHSAHLPRFGIVTEADQMITAAHQAEMYKDLPPEHILRLDSSHACFFSKTKDLAESIMRFSSQL